MACMTFNLEIELKTLKNNHTETLKSDPNRQLFGPCDLQIWQMTLKNYRAPLPCPYKLCVSFHSHPWIQIGAIVRKRSNWSQIVAFISLCDLKIWQMAKKKQGTFFILLEDVCYPIGVIRKQQTEAKFVLTSVTLIFDLWPWPFAWTSFLSLVLLLKIPRWYYNSNGKNCARERVNGLIRSKSFN